MIQTSQIQGLAGYFRHSGRFYYFITDLSGNFTYVNPLFQQHFGHLADDFYGMSSSKFFAGTDGEAYPKIVEQCKLNPRLTRDIDLHVQLANGELAPVKWEISVITNPEHQVQNIQAVGFLMENNVVQETARVSLKEMPERLEAWEESAEGIWMFETENPVPVNLAPEDILAYWRKHAYLAECNDNMARMYGFHKAEDLIGSKLDEMMQFDDPSWSQYMKDFIRNGFRSTGTETKEYDRYGNTIYFLNNIKGVVENGMLKRVWGTQQDITEQKLAAEKAKHLARLVESVSDFIISEDKDLRIVSWNQAAEHVFGYTLREMYGKKIDEVMKIEYKGSSREMLLRTLRKNGVWKGEAYVTAKNGKNVPVLMDVSRLVNEAGERNGFVTVGKDITEKIKAEEALKQSELFYRNLIADSIDGMLLTDREGMIHMASPSITKILGYEPEEVIGHVLFEYGHPDDLPLGATTFADEVRQQPRVKFISIRLRKKSGEWLWCIVRGHNLLDNPYVGSMVIYFADDTRRRIAEEALIESEKKARNQAIILNNVTDIIVTTDTSRKITSWNKVAEKLSGIRESEAIGHLTHDIVDTSYAPYTHEQVAEIARREGIWRGELSFTGADGERKHLLHTVSLLKNEDGKEIGLLGVGKDITDRKRAQEKLLQSELFYRSMISNSLDGIVMCDSGGHINYSAPSVINLLGYEPDKLLGKNVFEFVHPDDLSNARETFQLVLENKEVPSYLLLRLKNGAGNWSWFAVRAHNLLQDAAVGQFVIFFADDTKRKEAEDRLKSSEKHFRDLIYNLNQGIIILDNEGKLVVSNYSAQNILGYSESKLLAVHSSNAGMDAIHEDGRRFESNEYPSYLALTTKTPVHDIIVGAINAEKNERIWLLVNADPTLDQEGRIINVVVSFTDITEQRKLSQQLIEQEIQKQKQLTQATIDGQEKERQEIGKELHDNINQHLTTTRLYLEVAREKASGDVLEMIRLSHKTLVSIVNEIRRLSQSLVPPTLGDLGLVESVHDLCDSIKNSHAFNIEFFNRHFSEEDMPENMKLMVFRIIQEQVNNIIRHAQAETILIKLQSDAENIILTISDNGKGFDMNHYKKGLGFSNIFNRVSLFNGMMEIDASPGIGCTLSVTLPLTTCN